MNILINQPAGIGDIIFCQKIYHTLKRDDNKIYWPVKNSISWLTEYFDTVCKPEDLNGISINSIVNLDGCHFLIPNGKIMRSKYDILGLDFSNYLDYFNPKRNLQKEEKLFELKNPKTKYRLICDMHGTPTEEGITGGRHIPKSTTIENVVMSLEPGYSLFDWITVIKNAEEIHCTDSSILFLIEKYYEKPGELVCYSRGPDSSQVDYLLKKNWEHVI